MTAAHALNAAAFLSQALDLASDPEELALEIVSLKRDSTSGVSSIELDSSVGPAAFLIYDYQLSKPATGGISAREQFDADLRTLERAAEFDTPGPRILAHATAGDIAFILATTPAVHRALTGEGAQIGARATEADLPSGPETFNIRQEAATALMTRLRAADDEARRWLRAIQAEGRSASESSNDFLDFGEAEAALALYLLDDRSIQHLLQALHLFVVSAKEQASDALGER